MRTPATHARHDRPDSQRAAAPLLACTHREDLPRHARALSRRGAARRLLPREGAGSSPARPRLHYHDSARLSARGARLHALDGARTHEPRGRSARTLRPLAHLQRDGRRARGLHCGPTARRASASGGVRLAAPHRTRGGRPHPRRGQRRRSFSAAPASRARWASR